MRSDTILIHYGEIALKGRNRPQFERQLRRNVARRLASLDVDWPVRWVHDGLRIEIPPAGEGKLDAVLMALREISGIVWFAAASSIPNRTDGEDARVSALADALTKLALEHYAAESTFAVRVNRADKRFPLNSQELERRLGQAVIQHTPWRRVNLNHPDRTFHVDIQPERVYLHVRRHGGLGGLPVGTAGRVLTLVSGGLDSPVAAFLAAKRGCWVDCIHFAASLMQHRHAVNHKISRLAEHLSSTTLRTRLYLVPYTHFEVALLGGRTEYELVLFRRFMARTAQVLAERIGAQALVTGDNLGQVASQTMENLASFSRAVDLPVLRPLITYDKQEIVNVARRIGTFDISVEPYKDCCSIIGRHPKTRSRHEALNDEERHLLPDYEGLIERTLQDAVVLEYECGERRTTETA
ncbi:MAG: tRNA 4-thiouridine(8) synthase ThiI [Gammaproteobacteria bacterium]|nr:tRNA 4-thiouridine(8) synthase ThiI [Gammaproteobacteria bacterium]NIR84045.1 tRNA 4-thiouridine(8) synthase ThiI [Gammaproteobacteria bacterium]NIR89189.1 tRNA 4-thiouridine(8) synthase ThiI [Gammaproteobacteria bacterium]NIU04991.1 tRNA 4-thiouridine(8) synthase ThiI [Gammaproteobacteria bacterium]NIV52157.1 tRNA 4-thiouridine(8) synthase ThiI [Gammaproteobacteria bacterium]